MSAAIRLLTGDWNTLGEAAYSIRHKVFVVEQKVPLALEHDEADAISLHVLALNPEKQPIATGRLLPDGHIGRVAVLPEWRKHGVGRQIMLRLLEEASKRGDAEVVLHAQTDAECFYAALGFVSAGDAFMEAGIAHRIMRKTLQN